MTVQKIESRRSTLFRERPGSSFDCPLLVLNTSFDCLVRGSILIDSRFTQDQWTLQMNQKFIKQKKNNHSGMLILSFFYVLERLDWNFGPDER